MLFGDGIKRISNNSLIIFWWADEQVLSINHNSVGFYYRE